MPQFPDKRSDHEGPAIIMKLTPKQQRQLEILRRFKDDPPTIGKYFRINWKIYLAFFVVGFIGVGYGCWIGWHWFSALVFGMVVAATLRDLGWYRQIVRNWPLTDEVTNWNRVDELLDEQNAESSE